LQIKEKIKDKIIESKFLETLFVFATNKKAVETILEELQSIKMSDTFEEISLEKNTQISFDLLYPQYEDHKNDIINLSNPLKFSISENDLETVNWYLKCIPIKVFLVEYNVSLEIYKKIMYLIDNKDKFFKLNNDKKFNSIESLIKNLINYINLNTKYLKDFKKLEDDCIVHFKKIKISPEKIEDFNKMLIANKHVPERVSLPFEEVYITKLSQHYYNPLIYINPKYSKVDWIKNIIDVPSEGCFIENLIPLIDFISEKYIWYFSKLNEKYDKKIFIPYLKNGELHLSLIHI
jgi:type III restriction enzyme